ncbi:MAG: TIGR03016 family PEP-CTERM system-associated outer membrane protein [Ectothiorhodospiraceae bacterium]|nr:TIGR03016 family PEP-CTERM system-associated outer membrane protein [Ectothiorhodospiraceae bacterium]
MRGWRTRGMAQYSGTRALAGPLAVGIVAMAILVPAAAQQLEPRGPDTGQTLPDTLAGCSLPLPGGGDLDSGLSGLYLDGRRGRPYLLAPSLTLRQSYSDNITLAPEDGTEDAREKESDWVTQLIPAISLCRSSARLVSQLDYEAQLTAYAGDSDRNDVFHRLNATNRAVIMRERLFLDLGATYAQEPITTRGAFADDNIIDTDNRTDALRLRASPYLLQDLGPVGSSVLRYTFNHVDYDERDVADTTRHSGSLLVTSPGDLERLGWRASVRSEQVSRRGEDRNSYFDEASLELSYRVWGRFELLGRGGVETEPLADGRYDRFGSDFWDVGFRWADERTAVEARYGERFYGDTWLARISRRTARHTASLSYTETQQISDRFVVLAPEDLGLPPVVPDPDTGEPLEIPSIIVAENEVFISKRATASSNYVTGRSLLRLSVFREDREFQVLGDDEQRLGAEASWRWQWLPRTAIIPRANWEQVEFRDGRKDIIRGYRLSLAHLISPNMQGGISVRRQSRSSQAAEDEYVEHAVSAQITRLF